MTDRAISEEAMLTSLRDIDLPAQASGGVPADIAMTIGLAGVAALFVALTLRLFSLRQRTTAEPSLRDQLIHASGFPEAERRVLLLHVLRNRAPERYGQVAHDLYSPNGTLDADQLEAELERLV